MVPFLFKYPFQIPEKKVNFIQNLNFCMTKKPSQAAKFDQTVPLLINPQKQNKLSPTDPQKRYPRKRNSSTLLCTHLSRKSQGHGEKVIGADAGSVEGRSARRVEARTAQRAPDQVEHQHQDKDERGGYQQRRPRQDGLLEPDRLRHHRRRSPQRRREEHPHESQDSVGNSQFQRTHDGQKSREKKKKNSFLWQASEEEQDLSFSPTTDA